MHVERGLASTRLDEGTLGALAERARSGEAEAFEEMVRRLQGPVRAYTRRMMRDPHLGDDAAQETFFRMWKGLGRFQTQGRFVAWTFTVARNTCIELLRRETRTPRPAEDIDAGSVDPYDTSDLSQVVGNAIAELGEPYRSAILLRETGLQYDEMADALDCPVGTIRSRLHEARKLLAERLRPVLQEAV